MKSDKSYLTAIGRTSLSSPNRWLLENNRMRGRVLDYGCGRGFDADYLGIEGYDPHYRPGRPTGKYDTILCSYVLNVLRGPQRAEVLVDIRRFLGRGARAYITVRRGIKREGPTSVGTWQENVVLPFPVLKKTSWYCIYEMDGLEAPR